MLDDEIPAAMAELCRERMGLLMEMIRWRAIDGRIAKWRVPYRSANMRKRARNIKRSRICRIVAAVTRYPSYTAPWGDRAG